MNKNSQKGFSLIEMLIVLVGIALLMGFFAAFVLRVQIAQFVYNQQGETNDRNKIIAAQLQKDFEYIGTNFVSKPQNGTSGSVSSSFTPSSIYRIEGNNSNVRISKLSSRNKAPLNSAYYLRSGNGQISFTPNVQSGWIGWQTPANEMRAVFVENGTDFSIVEDNEVVVRSGDTMLDGNRAGDSFVISLNVDQSSVCSITYYRLRQEERQFIYKSNLQCPAYPLQAFVNLSSNDVLESFSLSGTWFEPIPGNNAPSANFPLMPTYRGERLTAPLAILSDNSFAMIPTDENTDAVNLASDIYFSRPEETVQIQMPIPLRGRFEEGDICILFDYENNKSVLGKIRDIRDDGTIYWADFQPAIKYNQEDFNNFYSFDEDFAGQNFTTSARLLKLKNPVTYRAVKDNTTDGYILSRKEGKDLAENLAYGLTNFSISSLTDNYGGTSFHISYDLAVEDQNSTEPQKGGLTISPKALNFR